MVTSWMLRARSSARVLGDIFQDWSGTLVERYNLPDTLQVTGQTSELRALANLAGGVVLDDATARRFSGPLASFTRRGDGTCTATFESDLIWLWCRICYADPTTAWSDQSGAAADVRSGPTESVALAFANANAGPGALVARRVPGLIIPTTLGRGGTATVTARFDVLGRLIADLGEAAGLRFRVLQTGTTLPLTVTASPDLTGSARYGTPAAGGPGLIGEDWEWTITKPDVDTALVAGGGEGIARVTRERTDTAAQATWGRRTELLLDQGGTQVLAELDKAGDDALLAGAQPVDLKATILDSPDLRIGVDFPLGALGRLDLDGEVIVDRLRQVTTTIAADSSNPTVSVAGVVGSPDAGLTRSQKDFLTMRKSLQKVVSR